MSGRIVARPDGGRVEIIMSDGEDAAITRMSPTQAVAFAQDVLAAAFQVGPQADAKQARR